MSSKEKVLELLIDNRDSYVSGEQIAVSLGLSRNAIWKAINDLRKSGYEIVATNNKGYCLTSNNDIISLQGIKAFLKENNIPQIIVVNTIESTNRTAKEMAINGAKHGTTIVAGSQTAGIAHNNESFASPSGGLYMSVILDPNRIEFDSNRFISPYSAIAVCKAIKECTDDEPKIDLITDIFLGDKKIAGILNESAFDFETGKLQWIVVGIGIPNKIHSSRNEIIASILENLLYKRYATNTIIDEYKKLHK